MQFKPPKDDSRFTWTLHAQRKLFQYGLSPNLVKKIIRRPDRCEEGIAQDTVAVMKRKDTKSSQKEAWVMYQKSGAKKRIISAWIYPGQSPLGKEIFIPDEVWEELKFKPSNHETPNQNQSRSD